MGSTCRLLYTQSVPKAAASVTPVVAEVTQAAATPRYLTARHLSRLSCAKTSSYGQTRLHGYESVELRRVMGSWVPAHSDERQISNINNAVSPLAESWEHMNTFRTGSWAPLVCPVYLDISLKEVTVVQTCRRGCYRRSSTATVGCCPSTA